MRYSTKLFLYFILVVVICTFTALAIVFFGGRHLVFKQIQSQMLSLTDTASSFIDGDAIQQWHSLEDTHSPAYKDLVHELRELRNLQRRSDIFIRYLYVIREEPSGEYIFIADAEENPHEVSYFGDPAPVATTYLEMIGSTPFVTPKPYQDSWGTWFTAYVSIYDKQEHVAAVLCMDVSVEDLYHQLDKLIVYGVIALAGALSAAVIVAYILARVVTVSLRKICEALRKIQQGNLDTRIHLNTKDEFQQLAIAINDMAKNLQEKERLTIAFGRYVSHHVLETLLSSNQSTNLQGERKKVTILFCDIHQFTTIAELLAPEIVVSLLNEYLEKMISIIFAHQGTLDKFIGDGIMAEFGVPLEDPLQELHALQTALEMIAMSKKLSLEWQQEQKCAITVGIGVHTGLAIIGNIGSQVRMEYTAIGDTVNVASRLEKVTKNLLLSLVISEETYKAVKDSEDFIFKDLGLLQLYGREQSIRAYSVTHKEAAL